jgi:hypothetical protein
MAGSNPQFDSAAFRTGIKFAMQMASPETLDEQAAFYMPTTTTYNKGVDGENFPFDPTATKTSVTPPSIKVDCAIEFRNADDQQTPFGEITPAKVVITLLDVDYAQVVGFSHVLIRGEKYIYHHTEPSVGLFDATVYTVHALAELET